MSLDEAGTRRLLRKFPGFRGDPALVAGQLRGIAKALETGDVLRAQLLGLRTPFAAFDAGDGRVRSSNRCEPLRRYDPDEPRVPAGNGRESGEWTAFEAEYDNLGPVEFAKAVIRFGDRLGREGSKFSATEQQGARARYAFLQNRLSFWLSYPHKPATADANLLSAALTLYQGAVRGGIVPVGGVHGGLPSSMLDVAVAVSAYDNAPPPVKLRLPWEPLPDRYPDVTREQLGEVGGIVDNREAEITWNSGIGTQGLPLEVYLRRKMPNLRLMAEKSKTFDLFDDQTGEAVSAKTLNTTSYHYAKSPGEIYYRVKRYIDKAANYTPAQAHEVLPSLIKSKTIHLAVPEATSPVQWRQLSRAARYAKSRGISLIVTRVR